MSSVLVIPGPYQENSYDIVEEDGKLIFKQASCAMLLFHLALAWYLHDLWAARAVKFQHPVAPPGSHLRAL